MKSPKWNSLRCGVAGLALLVVSMSTGCQIWEAGQTLPSPYYLKDDIQYFPTGAEFKLSKEAAAQKAYQADIEAQRAARRN